ncbi:MAG: PAS domain S-box protein, partial [Bacteroidales bacterium]|nr:PAS domain S-box protein [Bacteroidales bacterium]
EQALINSEEKYRTVADFTYSWEYWIDPNMNFIYVSPSCERISGYKPEDFIQNPKLMEQIIHPDDKDKVFNHSRDIELKSKKVSSLDFRIITSNGDLRWIGHVCRTVYGKDGNHLGWRATNRDITDSKREETIRQMMFQISNAVHTTKDLNELYKVIHQELSNILKTENFFIALYNKENDTITLPYFVDEKDDYKSYPLGKTLTAYVLKNNKHIIVKENEINNLIQSGEIEVIGTPCKIWLGVPLISKNEVIGILAVQSYENEEDYDKKDLELLKFISSQVGLSIERKQSDDLLHIQRDLALELNAVIGLDNTLEVCLNAAIRISGMDCGGIYLVDELDKSLNLVYHKGLPAAFIKSASHFKADSKNARLVMAGKFVYSQNHNLGVDINNTSKYEKLRAIAVIPIHHKGKVIACLNIASHTFDEIPDYSRIALQTIAAQIGSVITRVNAEGKLLESEERFKKISSSAYDSILVIDNDGNISYWNEAAEKTFGYTKDEIIGKNLHKILAPTKYHNDYKENFKKFKTTGQGNIIGKIIELPGIKKDGTEFSFELSLSSIKIKGKWHAVGILRDITERKQNEHELKIAKEKAEESDRLKSAFLANMSHEIRTPMNAILGFSQLLNEAESIEERNDFINFIKSNGEHLLSLINDIVDISKIEAGLMTTEINECSVNLLFEEIYSIFSTNEKIIYNKIQLILNKSLPDNESIILTDSTRLRQILTNLIVNAIKFTKSGYIEYGYYLKEQQTLEFYVKDTGKGIPENKHEEIFKRFVQADISDTITQGGTGLGLAITKAFVNLLGGEIRIKSEIDKGSTFYFTLPYKKTEPIAEIQVPVKKTIDYIWKNKTILIAEDVEDNFILIKNMLNKTQAQIIWARNGKETIDIYIENKNIDLILMDLRMPVINGYEAIKKIKKFNTDIPIIALTAYAIGDDHIKAFEYGCDDYVTKPVNRVKLLSLIDSYF